MARWVATCNGRLPSDPKDKHHYTSKVYSTRAEAQQALDQHKNRMSHHTHPGATVTDITPPDR